MGKNNRIIIHQNYDSGYHSQAVTSGAAKLRHHRSAINCSSSNIQSQRLHPCLIQYVVKIMAIGSYSYIKPSN